ncbi:MAG: TRAP transporter small permease [Candidatus Adiutrix sp.]|nr:TRAP transporter small permease [Candidatus Adiutrix sp.]
MNGVLRILKKFAAVIQKIINAVSVTLMAVMVAVMFSQVALRTFSNSSLIWSEEALRFMFIWMVFLGVTTAVYYNDLSRFELIQESLPPLGQKILNTVIHFITGTVLYFAAIGALPLVRRQMTQLATALPIKMGVVYLVIPVSAVVGLFYLALHLFLMWRGLPELSRKEEGSELL